MGKLIPLNNITKLDIPVDRVLENAKDNLDGVILIGYDKDGEEYFASTFADGGEVLWLLKRMETKLLQVAEEGVEGHV
jgi:hypothetical protein